METNITSTPEAEVLLLLPPALRGKYRWLVRLSNG